VPAQQQQESTDSLMMEESTLSGTSHVSQMRASQMRHARLVGVPAKQRRQKDQAGTWRRHASSALRLATHSSA
jgi:hypothetical protein